MQGVLSEPDSVIYASKNSRALAVGRSHFLAGIGESNQVAGEIAAINTGDILRTERPEITRVVPIVKVPAETKHLPQ